MRMTVYRDEATGAPSAEDRDGALAIEVDLEVTHCEPAEPQVGFGGCVEVAATCRGWAVELTEAEHEDAAEMLLAEKARPAWRRAG